MQLSLEIGGPESTLPITHLTQPKLQKMQALAKSLLGRPASSKSAFASLHGMFPTVQVALKVGKVVVGGFGLVPAIHLLSTDAIVEQV